MPRPPIQHHKLIISFDEDAKEVIEEVRQTFLLGKVTRAVGEAVKGLIGHPAGLVALLTAMGLGFLLVTVPGRAALEAGSAATATAVRAWWSTFLSPVLAAGGVTPEVEDELKQKTVLGAWDFIKGFLPFVPPGLP